jgi:hypothetical protein
VIGRRRLGRLARDPGKLDQPVLTACDPALEFGGVQRLVVLPEQAGRLVLEGLHEAVLSKSIWGVDFFMLWDRDSRPSDSPEAELAKGSGRLRTLSRYHLENYFLDEAT